MRKVESVLTKFKTSQALFDLLVWTSLYIAYSKSRSETIKYIILQNRSQNSKLNLIPDSTERQKLNLNLFVENGGIGQEKRGREKRGKGGRRGGGGGGGEGRSKAASRTPSLKAAKKELQVLSWPAASSFAFPLAGGCSQASKQRIQRTSR